MSVTKIFPYFVINFLDVETHLYSSHNALFPGIAQLWGPAFTESNTECILAFWAYISKNLTLYPTMHHVELDIHTNLESLDSMVMEEDAWNRCLGFKKLRHFL